MSVRESSSGNLDLASGKTLWTSKGGSPGFGAGSGRQLLLGDSEGVWVDGERFAKSSPTGTALWSGPSFFDGSPAYAKGNSMVCCDGERVLNYVSGPYDSGPEDEAGQRSFAESAVRNFELLDHTEKEQVVRLARFSTEPLIRRYVEWARSQQADYDRDAPDDEFGMMRYGLLEETGEMLSKMSGTQNTAALLKAIADLGPKNTYRDVLIDILGKRGRPEDFIEIYIAELRANRPKRGSAPNSGNTLLSVAESKHPAAVRFMIDALTDPKAPEDWRHEAFLNLAATGGAEGAAAVRQVRAKLGPRPRWEKRINIPGLAKRAVVSERKDGSGRTWRLFHSGVMGNHSDLFAVRQAGSKWEQPIFLGVFTERTWHLQAPKAFRGIPLSKFTKSEWIKIVPSDPALRRDTDGDGLTDLAETRLGTNRRLVDTDGDRLGDGVDPCPNAAPRPLGDKEKIIAACIEARFFDQGWDVPCTIEVEGVRPFELYGYPDPLLWKGPSYKGDLPKMYNTGVNSLAFRPYTTSMENTKPGTPAIQISQDGRTATTLISRYSGGLNGDGMAAKLIKVGDDWFVVSLKMVYVS